MGLPRSVDYRDTERVAFRPPARRSPIPTTTTSDAPRFPQMAAVAGSVENGPQTPTPVSHSPRSTTTNTSKNEQGSSN